MSRNILQSSIQSIYYNVSFQVFCRLFTFAINIFLIRIISKDFLGIINVRLILLESTLLFLSREPINRATLSVGTHSKKECNWAQIVNQIWLTVPICFVLAVPCIYTWINLLSPVHENLHEQYRFSCIAIVISCLIQLCAELPSFLCQVYCFVKVKVFFDTLLLFARSFIFIMLAIKYPENSIKAFGIAQILSAFIILVGYYIYFHIHIKRNELTIKSESDKKDDKLLDTFPFHSVQDMIPGMLINENQIFNSGLQTLTLSFVKQSILKQILTEGEKYVMSISPVLTFGEQAVYDMVNNLGSLTARFIFRPVEDSSYFYFTQTIARDVELNKQNQEKVFEAGHILATLCKIVSSIGLIAFTFAQSYAKTVLLLYAGRDFIADGLAEYLLRYHALAIYFLAVNGITECYMFATNRSEDINRYNYYMGIYSLLFLIFSYCLTIIFGPVGFILANCINMFLRILYSCVYIHKKFKSVRLNPLKGLIPGHLYFAMLSVFGPLCKISEIKLFECCLIYHVIIGGIAVLICLLSWFYENKTLITFLYKKYREKSKINKNM